MKQVINKRGAVSVEEVPAPVCGPGEVKVALTHSLISAGTELSNVRLAGQGLGSRARERPDLVKKVIDRARSQGIVAAYRAVQDKLNEPRPLGYSAAGVVVEVGRLVTGFTPGDRVACGGATACHAEIVVVPENLVVHVPEEVPLDHAAFATVGSIAMQGIRRARPEFGEVFVVFGLGLVGQLCVRFAKNAGLRVLGFDLMPDRVERAKELGADAAWAVTGAEAVERVADFTNGWGADAVVVAAATSSSDPMNTAMAMLRERGRVSIVGAVGLELQRGVFYMKELDVHMSRSYGPGRYDRDYEERGMKYPPAHVRWTETQNMAEVLRQMRDGLLRVDGLISAAYPIEEADKAYAALQEGDPKPLGVILTHRGLEAHAAAPAAPKAAPNRTPRERVRVALVGCGPFAKLERLPYLSSMKAFELRWLVSRSGPAVKQLAAQLGVDRTATDYREALADPEVDLLIVATPHSLHASIAIDAAEAGKDLLVEKPMAIDEEELEEVYARVGATGVRYSVGFNRRFAPASQRLKAWRDSHRGPCSVLYRCSHLRVDPATSTMHKPEEGNGLIVGEACHFFDFCNWLVGAAPVSVTAQSISYSGTEFAGSDNLSSVVKYADGSTATIVYAALGHPGLGKERIEAFCGGEAAVLDDFKTLEFHGTRREGWKGSGSTKGHRELMAAVVDAYARGDELPIGLEAAYLSHKVMFAAMESARTGSVRAL